ncbi:hypothetical protein F511_17605 [Dorcoceras hygrometricum]|uniref:Uncharacterized protein n=1 Tax=Dorcoceras hygrometricum TaxID=472368 RepID=A0A2Z7AJI6_9LAMI|nr:hypothetical protein F511_17605 [Dorcoceras hygrometricum]
MRTRSDRRPNRNNDRKVLVPEESTKSWEDTDSESSSSSSSSSDSEQEEVHCFMADQTPDDEVFDFSNVEFTREDLVSALNDMVKEYRKLSHSFEEVKAENISLKSSSIESSSDELEDIDSLKIELRKLTAENDLFRNESMHDRTGLGFNSSDSSEGETSSQSQPAYDKFNKMGFVKANVIYDCFESITFDDQNSPKLNENGKAGIGFSKPENSKPSWLKNKLDKDKAKAGQKPFGVSTSYLSGTCAWLQPVFQEPGASRLSAVDSSIRSTTRLEAPSSDCTRSPDEISTIGFSTSNWPETVFRRRSAAATRGRRRSVQGEEGAAGFRVRVDSSIKC